MLRLSRLIRVVVLSSFIAAAWPSVAYALGQKRYIEYTPRPGSFPLSSAGHIATITVDPGDYPGVIRAAHDLEADLDRVTGLKAPFAAAIDQARGDVLLIGTIGESRLIDRLIHDHKLDVSSITGKWESTLIQVVDKPIPGVRRALVIAGSDKRGTIFGIYDVSEQIGVSPWYWWADVPVVHRDALYVAPGMYITGEPAVKYRGIFLNDEAPALTGFVNATYGGYNSKFYVKVFELLLRLKANYLWPAMWNSAFNEDDPLNPRLADEYGIVMGTSHHEPMLRAQQEWKRHGNNIWDYASNSEVLNKFWSEGIERNKNYESTITLGMRGDGDMPMSEGANIALLEKIVANQRRILAEHETPTLKSDLKIWALYKEVQEYYEKGMRVPDDVTLLWCDDNWGNIRRLPTPEERKRPGGAGIYYHFDYVGDPRNYKWINTNPIAKVWEQMHLALDYGADRVWIVNVGDLKPMEFPIDYFLNFARDPGRWGKDQTVEFTQLWAQREFGAEHANEIAELVTRYGQYAGRRKPELLDPDTFSLIHYGEADRIQSEWNTLLSRAEALRDKLPAAQQDAYFELVLHPVKAYATVLDMYIAAGKNHLYARQGRASANQYAVQTRTLFKADAELSDEYNHKLAGGKWNHMMDQTHIGYSYWQQPPVNVMPGVSEVQPLAEPSMGIAVRDGANSFGISGFAPGKLTFDSYRRQSRIVDIFNRGIPAFHFSATPSRPWIVLSAASGDVSTDAQVEVSVDWAKAPSGKASGEIIFTQQGGAAMKISVDVFHPDAPPRNTVNAFVESDGYVAIEAEHFCRATSAGTGKDSVHWERIPNYGATLSGMTVVPSIAPSVTEGPRPTLEYRVYLFNQGTYTLQATLGPTLNFVPGRGLRMAVSLDDGPQQVIDTLKHNSDKDWSNVVSDNMRRVETSIAVGSPGYHTLKIGMVDPAMVLERLVLSDGPLRPSYLGPPESYHSESSDAQPVQAER